MRWYLQSFSKSMAVLFTILFSLQTVAQGERILIEPVEFESNNYFIAVAPVGVTNVEDPANHECCVAAPPESVAVSIQNGDIAISSPDSSHWLNFVFPISSGTTTAEGETSSTIAGFDDVRSTFFVDIYQNVIEVVATLGADGELFDETIVYTLEIDLGNGLIETPPINQAPVEKVKSVGGSSNASFQSGASADGGATTGTSFSANDNVTIAGTINIDPVDQGESGEIYVALLAIQSGSATLSYMNEDGNFEVWDQTIAGLGAHITTDSLNESYNITVSSGTLEPGTYRVALAYSRGSKLIYAPKAIVLTVN